MAKISPKNSTKKPHKFIVVVDTNIIWTNEEFVKLVPDKFAEDWKQINKKKDIELFIPNVVFEELSYQKYAHICREYNDASAKIKRNNQYLSKKISLPASLDKRAVRAKISKALLKQIKDLPLCSIAATPYREIATEKNIQNIIQSSVWREPPFSEDKEGSGFRDAVILETLKSIHDNLNHCDIAFICKDGRLKQAVQNEFKNSTHFGTYADLKGFENFVTAARNKYTAPFLHKAIKLAAIAFYNPKTAKGFFIEKNLESFLVAKYNLKLGGRYYDQSDKKPGVLSALGFGSAYECVNKPVYLMHDTKFLSITGGNIFHWNTAILISADYREIGSLITTDDEKKDKNRLLRIDVEWECQVDNNLQFSNFVYQADEINWDIFEDISKEEKNKGVIDNIDRALKRRAAN